MDSTNNDSRMDSDRQETMLIAERAVEWLNQMKTAGPEERAAFLGWLRESPLHVREALLATTWDMLLANLDPKRELNIQDLANNASANIVALHLEHALPTSRPTATHRRAPRRARWPWISGFAAAASALLLVAMNLLSPQQYRTTVGEQRAVELADGSIIHLNTQTDVEVDFSSAARDVYLHEGQVIFKVRHDAARPFRVHVGETVIQAIGTQFDVYRQSDRTNVSVIEGVVQIIPAADKTRESAGLAQIAENTRIAAGELVSIVVDGEITPPAPVNVVEVNAWQQRRLVFRRHTLEEIATEFNRYNRRLQIRVQGEALKSIRFSGVFDADDPESLLEYLRTDHRISFTRDNENLVILPRQEPPEEHAPVGSTI